jgi:antitoxin MazE
MRAVVKRWGNSAAVRIPRGVMQAAKLEIEQAVDISEADGQVLIVPVRTVQLDLKQLLRGITRKNLHEPVDSGAPIGRELL